MLIYASYVHLLIKNDSTLMILYFTTLFVKTFELIPTAYRFVYESDIAIYLFVELICVISVRLMILQIVTFDINLLQFLNK